MGRIKLLFQQRGVLVGFTAIKQVLAHKVFLPILVRVCIDILKHKMMNFGLLYPRSCDSQTSFEEIILHVTTCTHFLVSLLKFDRRLARSVLAVKRCAGVI